MSASDPLQAETARGREKKHLGTCTHTPVHSSPSGRYTDQAGKSCEGFFLMGHSASVVTSDAHPLGQDVLAAQDAKVEKT